jgi:adiponectin receptor
LADWHNETVNIHSHLWGAAAYLALLPLHFSTHITGIDVALKHLPAWTPTAFHFGETISSKATNINAIQSTNLLTPRPQTLVDTLALSIFLCSAVGCLTLSGYFHLVQCTSKERCDSAHRGDYVGSCRRRQTCGQKANRRSSFSQIGIVILIVGSFWPSLYYGQYAEPVLYRRGD